MRKVTLNMKEQLKYEVIKDVSIGRINIKRAALKLGLTERSIYRLLKKYKDNGKDSFSHKNKSKKPAHSISEELKNEIVSFYLGKYEGSNFTHFSELLEKHEGIKVSEGTIRKIMKSRDIISPMATRKTKRDLKKKILAEYKSLKKGEQLSQNDVQTIDELSIEDIHPSRPAKKNFGELLQVDASEHKWFAGLKSHLHAAIDDSTGCIVSAYFDKQETLYGYYKMFEIVLKNYGIPYELLTDKRTVFEYKKRNVSSLDKDTFTQFSYACKILGTHISTTSVPQAKGKIERLFGTLQSRLVTELKIRQITTIEEANNFLPDFIEEYNSKFSLPINDSMNVMESVKNLEEIDTILSIRVPRKINNGACIKFNNKTYYPELDGERKYFTKSTEVLVIKSLSGLLYTSIGEKLYHMVELDRNQPISKEFEQMPSDLKKKKEKYIPPMSHPWKHQSFLKYVSKQDHLKWKDIEQMF